MKVRPRRPSGTQEQATSVGGAHIEKVSGPAKVKQIGRDNVTINRQVIFKATPKTTRVLLREAVHTERIWNIPSPVRSFTGRETELADIETRLARVDTAALVPAAALHGMGGAGKSQLALAYAESHRAQYRLGWRLSAETELEIITGLARLAEKLGLEGEPTELAATVLDALRAEDSWLLIFDNAGPNVLSPFLPRTGNGAIVITSRNPAWPGIAVGLKVDMLPLETAVDLLLNRSGQTDREAARELAEELGCLPLALEQAASYMAGPPMLALNVYIELFRQRRAELLAVGTPVAYGATVDATFSLAVDRLKKLDPAAVRLLELFAFLAPETIPVGWLARATAAEILPGRIGSDPVVLHEALGHLCETGLLTEETADTMRMHRLVQDVVRAHLTAVERRIAIITAIVLLDELTPDSDNPANWPVATLLLPHAQVALAHARHDAWTDVVLASLATSFGNFVVRRGLGLDLAAELHGQALDVARSLRGGDHPEVATSLSNLAPDFGTSMRARKLNEEALAMRRRLFSGDHRDIASSLNNLATDYGTSERARALFEEALAMRRRLFSGDHRDIGESLSNLAVALSAGGETERAIKLQEEALAMRRRLYPGDHADVAMSLSILAADLGTSERARALEEEALAMRRRLYPGDHADVAMSLDALALDLRAAGETERAIKLQKEALAMRRRLYPGDHADVARNLSNLAIDLRTAGEMKRTSQLDEEALAMRRRLYPGDHTDVATSLSNLAIDLREVLDLERALELDEEALSMLRRLFPGGHAAVATSLSYLAIDFRLAGDPERARRLDEEALAMLRRGNPGDHRDVAAGFASLAADLRDTGESKRARELDEEARAMLRRLRGS